MCPRQAAQLEQLKGERRRAVLRAAREVFARKGYAAAKIVDIAAAAGISHGLVHHYFPGKEALFAAVIQETVEAWETLVAEVRQQPGTPWERLVHLCSRMMRGLYDEPEHLLVIVHAYTEDAALAVRDGLNRYQRQIDEPLVALIEEAQRDGAVTPGPPEELARAWMAMVKGLAIGRVMNPASALPPLELVLRILKASYPHSETTPLEPSNEDRGRLGSL
ncbi:MAG: TetR/AcrR family transcriptional regulator [Hyalangium sp.]|uniref:TetR/AcrR family transcriptional regulator n=1 Tax=Hyalangium sp. TaxID=2028555 RepID=UPI00389A8890